MTAPDVVRGLFDALDAGRFGEARALMADDFAHVSRRTPDPVGPDAWLAAYRPLIDAFPGLSHGIEGLEGDDRRAKGAFRIHGVHRGRLLLPGPGIDLAPTGRSFELPREPFEATARGGLLTGLHVENPPGGGLDGVLAQLRGNA